MTNDPRGAVSISSPNFANDFCAVAAFDAELS